jgi:hypothetical protein
MSDSAIKHKPTRRVGARLTGWVVESAGIVNGPLCTYREGPGRVACYRSTVRLAGYSATWFSRMANSAEMTSQLLEGSTLRIQNSRAQQNERQPYCLGSFFFGRLLHRLLSWGTPTSWLVDKALYLGSEDEDSASHIDFCQPTAPNEVRNGLPGHPANPGCLRL